MSRSDGVPATFIESVAGRRVQQTKIFDPALRHFPHAFRLGGPDLTRPADRDRWLVAKESVGRGVLEGLAVSELGTSLMLRGSWLLSLWLGSLARDPHDLDFVALESEQPEVTMAQLTNLLGHPELAELGVRGSEIELSEIWTYERAIGRRLAVPWTQGASVGVLQIDVTFDEVLDEPAETTVVGEAGELRTASLSQSLIWKLQWLLTDASPQGKDLFDAVLLNALSPLTAWHWQRVVARVTPDWHRSRPPGPQDIGADATEWTWFVEEYPDISTETSWDALRQELVQAVEVAARQTPT